LTADAAKQPGADAQEAQTGLKLLALLTRWRQGDRTVADALPAPKDDNDISALFINGAVLLDVGRADDAAANFKRIVDSRGQSSTTLRAITPLFYGRALAAQRKIDESRKAYEHFFEAFAHADPSLPILAAAKAEYARLKSAS